MLNGNHRVCRRHKCVPSNNVRRTLQIRTGYTLDLINIDTRHLREIWLPNRSASYSIFICISILMIRRRRYLYIQPTLWSTFLESHPYQRLGWSETSRPVGKMEDRRRSCRSSAISARRRTTKTGYCYTEGHVRWVLLRSSVALFVYPPQIPSRFTC